MPEQETEKPKKFPNLLKILKIAALVLLVLVALFSVYFAYRLSREDLFGWRLNFSLSKVETNDYQGISPTIAFNYPRIFEIDIDANKKYGKNYVAGIKLKTDDRTGCDIRLGGPELDFSKTAEELANEIVNPIKEKASNFQLLEKSKIKVGGRDALKVSFSFLDPIGARVRLDQIFTENNGEKFMIICGTGEYQYAFFQKDFNLFYSSINFEGKILDQRKWWQKMMFWKK